MSEKLFYDGAAPITSPALLKLIGALHPWEWWKRLLKTPEKWTIGLIDRVQYYQANLHL